jgi:hypothetical protein
MLLFIVWDLPKFKYFQVLDLVLFTAFIYFAKKDSQRSTKMPISIARVLSGA